MRSTVRKTGLLVPMIALFASAKAEAARPAAARHVYYVDVRRVLLATDEGRAVAKELDAARARTEAELNAREGELLALQHKVLASPTPDKIREYEKRATEMEEALVEAEAWVAEIEEKKVAPLTDQIRTLIADINESSRDELLLELERHEPINLSSACDATEWLIRRIEGAKSLPRPKREKCAVRFFLYVDVEKLKTEMKRTSEAQQAIEELREERLAEIAPTASSTAQPSRFELYLRYSQEEKLRRARERRHDSRMSLAASAFIARTARPMSGVLFLDKAHNGSKLTPSCEVTRWLIELEHGTAGMDDVARDCRCVWLNRSGNKIRIARGCGS